MTLDKYPGFFAKEAAIEVNILDGVQYSREGWWFLYWPDITQANGCRVLARVKMSGVLTGAHIWSFYIGIFPLVSGGRDYIRCYLPMGSDLRPFRYGCEYVAAIEAAELGVDPFDWNEVEVVYHSNRTFEVWANKQLIFGPVRQWLWA